MQNCSTTCYLPGEAYVTIQDIQDRYSPPTLTDLLVAPVMRPDASSISKYTWLTTAIIFIAHIAAFNFRATAYSRLPQMEYVKEAAIEEARAYAIDEIQKMFKSAFQGSKNITYKPAPRTTKRTVHPNYVEREVDTEFECAECSTRFQVYGVFGYCPGCSCENLKIYDANWANIKRKTWC